MNNVNRVEVCGVAVSSENTIGVFFAGGKQGDTLAILHRHEGQIHFEGRVRMYDSADPGNDAWSGKDQKVPFGLTAPPHFTEEDALASARRWLRSMPAADRYEEFLMKRHTVKEFIDTWLKHDFNHVKTLQEGSDAPSLPTLVSPVIGEA